mmetsp:Transcript_104363/g.183938  ORF Transcript_104363/g.183938 Transcript_104363/m.183938 type:complete len:99 (+) Transcript_104363:1649-1945(+)
MQTATGKAEEHARHRSTAQLAAATDVKIRQGVNKSDEYPSSAPFWSPLSPWICRYNGATRMNNVGAAHKSTHRYKRAIALPAGSDAAHQDVKRSKMQE